jgi:thiol-disulfide isomerase/thioredoxin
MRKLLLLALTLLLPLAANAVAPGALAPDVSAPQLLQPGPPVALKSLRGNVVYVDFWASWCVPCRLSMPALDTLSHKYGAQGFRVVGVNKDVTGDDIDRFLKRVNVSFILLADKDDAIAKAFDVQAMPSGYLVDRKGIVRYIHRGFTAQTSLDLSKEIEALLKDPA